MREEDRIYKSERTRWGIECHRQRQSTKEVLYGLVISLERKTQCERLHGNQQKEIEEFDAARHDKRIKRTMRNRNFKENMDQMQYFEGNKAR